MMAEFARIVLVALDLLAIPLAFVSETMLSIGETLRHKEFEFWVRRSAWHWCEWSWE